MERSKSSGFIAPSKIRPIVQGVFFILFVYLFLKLSYPFEEHFSKNLFFNLDPLIVLIVALTGGVVLTGLLVSAATVVVTVLFGRVFCGWICPLGTLFDVFGRVIPQRKNRPPEGNGRYKNIKYYLLAFMVFGSLAGFSAALFFDPLVFIFRIFTLNVFPSAVFLVNHGLNLIRPLALKTGAMNLYMFSLGQPVFNVFGFLNLVVFLSVVGLLYVERRFWCRNLCPLGALLSLLSRFSIWGRTVNEECIHCSRCSRSCPMNAIGEGYEITSARECIQCMRCESVCPVNAVSFTFNVPPERRFEFNPSRRGVILAGLGGIAAALSAGTAAATKTRHGTLLRPPGALPEKDFLDVCLRCGECMKVCPTNALQPARLEAGIEGMFTPVLVPRIGGCEEQCNLCGRVCPTGAIRNLPLEEKQFAVIGNATIERNLCIAWEQLKVCLICDEVCPFDAVEFKLVSDEKGTLERPFVIEDKCVGCGQCEHGCPVNGPAAIHVTPIGEVRKSTGSYITEEKKRLREVDDEGIDFYEELDVRSRAPAEQKPPMPWEQPGRKSEDELPPGFVE